MKKTFEMRCGLKRCITITIRSLRSHVGKHYKNAFVTKVRRTLEVARNQVQTKNIGKLVVATFVALFDRLGKMGQRGYSPSRSEEATVTCKF